MSRIQGTNLEILVHTPGRLGSAHPMPQEMIPAKKYLPSAPRTCSGPPESPWKESERQEGVEEGRGEGN